MRAARVCLVALGLGAIWYAVSGIASDPGARPMGHLRFLATVLIGHDLVVLPLALAVGAVVSRWAPGWARGPIHAALFASATVAVVALPFVLGVGRAPDNPSALPIHYGRGLLVVLAVIWAVAAVAAIRRRSSTLAATRRHVATLAADGD
jgi:hypothetical protein